jgi:hypothetical protein
MTTTNSRFIVPLAKLLRLIESDKKLNTLIRNGVDNWHGYGGWDDDEDEDEDEIITDESYVLSYLGSGTVLYVE